jgi:hypothetical protein
MNNRSFENLENTLEEILSSFYITLYFWTTAYVHPLSFSFNNFIARFSFSFFFFFFFFFFSLIRCFLCIVLVY